MVKFQYTNFQSSKKCILDYYTELDSAKGDDIESVIASYTSVDYLWRGMHPFNIQNGATNVAKEFWKPFKESFSSMQRRADVFFTGLNEIDDFASQWVCQMGHFMGLFDKPWLGIKPTGKMVFIRFAEFNKVVDGKIVETSLFIDIPAVMRQAGYNPFMHDTGAFVIQPGPKTHDGLLFDDADPALGNTTLDTIDLMKRMVSEGRADKTRDGLGDAWNDDMVWFGPCGIGATYTKDRYQLQHRKPLVDNMNFDVPNHGSSIGHICRIAEGKFGGFFGWPNFYCIPEGNFMGLPATDRVAEFRVVDIYHVIAGKISENWIFMDLLHFMKTQGVDVLANMHARTKI